MGLTVTHAWAAALVLAILRTQAAAAPNDPTGNSQFASYAPKDLRPLIDSDRYDAPAHNISSYHMNLPFLVKRSTSFAELAAEFREMYTNSLSPARLAASAALHDLLVKNVEQLTGSPLSTFSSYGIIDKIVRKTYGAKGRVSFELAAVRASVVSRMPWTNWMLMSWDGELHLVAAANEAYFPDSEVDRCLELSRDILLEGLGVADGCLNGTET